MTRFTSLMIALLSLAVLYPSSSASAQTLNDLFRGLSNQGNNNNSNNSWNSGRNSGRNSFSQPNNRYRSGGSFRDVSDANDGPSNGGDNWPPPPSKPNNPFPWDRLVVDLIDAALKAPKPDRPYPPNRDYQPYYPPQRYTQPQYQPQYQPQQPQYQPVRPPAPVSIRKNVAPKPVERKKNLIANQDPQFDTSMNLTDGERDLMEMLATDKTEEKVEELEDKLGDAADDPAVKKELDEIKEKIANGEEVTQEDTDKLIAAAQGSGKLPPGFDPDKANDLVIEIEEWSALVPKLREEEQDQNGGLFPDGQTDVVNFPSLPQDDMVVLPDGTVLVGTGGQGTIGSVSMEASDVFGVPVGVGEPMPDYDGEFSKRVKEGVLIMNPAENAAEINYVISNTNYTMKAGHSQPLPEGRTWVIRFDRGQGHGEAKYTLSDGTYFFGSSDRGWELFKQSFEVTVDNTAHDADFNYNFDNTQAVVAGGGTETHRSNYPILLRFDRGDGEEVQKRILEKNAHLQIAVDPDAGFWNLFPAGEKLIAAKEAGGDKVAKRRSSGSAKSTPESSKTRAARLRALLLQTSSRD